MGFLTGTVGGWIVLAVLVVKYSWVLWHHSIVYGLFGDKHLNIMRHRLDNVDHLETRGCLELILMTLSHQRQLLHFLSNRLCNVIYLLSVNGSPWQFSFYNVLHNFQMLSTSKCHNKTLPDLSRKGHWSLMRLRCLSPKQCYYCDVTKLHTYCRLQSDYKMS